MAHMVETVTDNKADRSKETLSEAAHTTTLAPRSRNSSLLPSATAILTPPVVWEPATHGPTTGVHGEMYKWAAPKNLDIELLFGDFELTIPERVTVSWFRASDLRINLTSLVFAASPLVAGLHDPLSRGLVGGL